MKKLLSILAAVGLTATASTAVVACTTTVKAKDVTVTKDSDGNGTAVAKDQKIELAADVTPADAANNAAVAGTYAVFKGSKKIAGTVTMTFAKDYSKSKAKDLKKGKKVEANITVTGLVASDFAKKGTIEIGTIKKTDKLDYTVIKLDIKKAADWAASTPKPENKKATLKGEGTQVSTSEVTFGFDGTAPSSVDKTGMTVAAAKGQGAYVLDDTNAPEKDTLATTATAAKDAKTSLYSAKLAITVPDVKGKNKTSQIVNGWDDTDDKTASVKDSKGNDLSIGDNTKDVTITAIDKDGKAAPADASQANDFTATDLLVTFNKKEIAAGDYTLKITSNDCIADVTSTITVPDGSHTGDSAALTADQTIAPVTTATGTAVIKGTNLPTNIDASKIAGIVVKGTAPTTPITAENAATYVDSVSVNSGKTEITITFKALTKAQNGTYTVSFTGVTGTADVKIDIEDTPAPTTGISIDSVAVKDGKLDVKFASALEAGKYTLTIKDNSAIADATLNFTITE